MTVLVERSTCVDCRWIDSCRVFKKIDDIGDKRQNPGHTNDILEAIIINCSIKNCDRSRMSDNNSNEGMYYCTECRQMHHSGSRIGKLHNKIP